MKWAGISSHVSNVVTRTGHVGAHVSKVVARTDVGSQLERPWQLGINFQVIFYLRDNKDRDRGWDTGRNLGQNPDWDETVHPNFHPKSMEHNLRWTHIPGPPSRREAIRLGWFSSCLPDRNPRWGQSVPVFIPSLTIIQVRSRVKLQCDV